MSVSNKSSVTDQEVNAVSDAKFVPNTYYIVSRDFLSVKLWDLRKASDKSKPIYSAQVTDYIKNKYSSHLEDINLSDKFFLDVSPDGKHLATGGYNRSGHVIDINATSNASILCKFGAERDGNATNLNLYSASKKLPFKEGLELKKRVSMGCWSPYSRSLGT